MKAFALLLLLAVGAYASDMKVEVRLNDHVGHEQSRFYVNPGDFSCAKVARTHATDGQLHSKCGFQWSLERKSHEEITVGFHGPKSHLDVAFDLKCADVIHAASAKGAKTLIHDNLAADGSSSSSSHHSSSSHSSLIETENPDSSHHSSVFSHSDDSSSSHHDSGSSSSSSSHGIVLATLKISDDKFLADLAQYCGHDGSESSESSSESSSDESSSDESSSEGSSSSSSSDSDSSSGSDSGSSSSGGDSGSGSGSGSGSAGDSFSQAGSASQGGSESLPANSASVAVSQSASQSS